MSEADFHAAVDRMPEHFSELMSGEPLPMRAPKEWAGLHAIYVFYDANGEPCHVGRTRNLQGRIRAHTANSHHSASFAFKRARKELGVEATYRKGEGRADLLARPDFRAAFDRHRGEIREMSVRYVEIDCPIEQHLFELYAAMRLGTSLSEFTTS